MEARDDSYCSDSSDSTLQDEVFYDACEGVDSTFSLLCDMASGHLLTVEKDSGDAEYLFNSEQCEVAVFLSLKSVEKRNRCLKRFRNRDGYRSVAWLSPVHFDCGNSDQGVACCSLILVFKMDVPLGIMKERDLSRLVERRLAVPRSRGSRLHPFLRENVYKMCIEVIETEDLSAWNGKREHIFRDCQSGFSEFVTFVLDHGLPH